MQICHKYIPQQNISANKVSDMNEGAKIPNCLLGKAS